MNNTLLTILTIAPWVSMIIAHIVAFAIRKPYSCPKVKIKFYVDGIQVKDNWQKDTVDGRWHHYTLTQEPYE